MSTHLDKISGIALEVAKRHGFGLEDVELAARGRRKLLRVTIDKEGGVTLGDCVAMSRDLEAMLDLEDPIEGRYTLEVSSPGLDRPLRKPDDFKKQQGKLARVVLKAAMGGQSFLIGRIASASDGGVRLSVQGESFEIPFDNISRARLEVEI